MIRGPGQVSAVLHCSAKTIEVYMSRLYQMVGCHSGLELVLAAERGQKDLSPGGRVPTAPPLFPAP
jgi:hypothetical protein